MVGYAEAETAWPLLGLLVGVLLAAGIAWGMYAGAVRINLAKFFKYTGAFLIVVAAGILSYGIGALQTVGWLPALGGRAFDISSWFNWSSWYGEIIQGVFNITPTPTVLQLVCWLAYLAIVLTLFLRPTQITKPAPESDARPPHRKVDHVTLTDGIKTGTAALAAILAGVWIAGCTAKETKSASSSAEKASPEVTVDASDDAPARCRPPRPAPGPRRS